MIKSQLLMSYHCSLSQIRESLSRNKKRPKCKLSPLQMERMQLEKELREFPHPFPNAYSVFNALRIQPPSKQIWRLTPYWLGHINGLPTSWGRVTSTDGILCIIITEMGHFVGHISSFIPEDVSDLLDTECGELPVNFPRLPKLYRNDGSFILDKRNAKSSSNRSKKVAGIISDILEFV